MDLLRILLAGTLLSAEALTVSVTNPDETFDNPRFVSYTFLMEEKIEDKASDTIQLESELPSVLHGLNETQSKLLLNESINTVTNKQQIIPQGATYIRWGRETCPHKSGPVYKGFIGGTWRHDHGGSSSFLCLPEDPIYGNYAFAPNTGQASHIYGAMYGSLMSSYLHTEIVTCVVCQSYSNPVVLMVPAKKGCPQNWSLEYTGYLMGSQPDSSSSDNICVDENPITALSGAQDDEGLRLYPVESRCGTLPSATYMDNRVLTCSVCSK